LKHEAESDIGQRRKKIVEFASIPLGATLVSSSARLDTKDARILRLLERRREMTDVVVVSCNAKIAPRRQVFSIVLPTNDEKNDSACSLDVGREQNGREILFR
jgi:hypothetical protein